MYRWEMKKMSHLSTPLQGARSVNGVGLNTSYCYIARGLETANVVFGLPTNGEIGFAPHQK